MSRYHGDDGTVTTEMVIITPVAIALLCLIALVGRTATAREHVDEAARDAARSASLQRDPATATDAARVSATRSFDTGGFRCATTDIVIDTTRFIPGGQVAVTVSCDVELSDLGLIGLSGTRAITSTAVSVVDTFRSAT